MLPLSVAQPVRLELPLFNKTAHLQLAIRLDSSEAKGCGLLLAELLDAKGKVITLSHCGPLKFSAQYGKWYRYIVANPAQDDVFSLPIPAAAVLLRLTLKPWQCQQVRLRNAIIAQWIKPVVPAPVSASTLPAPKLLKAAAELRVALLADEFTYNSFRDEFQAITFTPDNWQQVFASEKPELFFCESAWSGADTVNRPWKGRVYASENFKQENRQVLLAILDYCKQHKIPTLFWNKEDPTHYTDRKHDFVKTAVLFDYVFTSAAECVAQYKNDYGVKQAFALPFATNPRLFNPLAGATRSNKVVFAGSWYANHEARSVVMEQVLDNLIAKGYEPEIYDRYYGGGDPLHQWPQRYQQYVKPGQPHDKMPAVYKSSKFGLNFNTVTDSATMFARRVFELMSSNTLVVSNYAKGVDEMFGDLVVFADRDPERLGALTATQIDALRQRALETVLSEHTYARRWRYMLQCIGYEVCAESRGITLISRISSHQQAKAAISVFEEQFGRDAENRLLLVVTEQVAEIDVAAFYQQYNRFGITVTAESFMRKHAISGHYQPVETPYFLLFDSAKPPKSNWVNRARLHLSYMQDYPLTVAGTDAYQLKTAATDAVYLGCREKFLTLYHSIQAAVPVQAYQV